MPYTRRRFLQTAAAVPLAAAVSPETARLPIGFSTLGCPKWTWTQILDFASAHGFAAVELRGILGEMDLTKRPEFAPDRLAASREDVARRDLRISCLGSSARMHEPDPEKRQAQMAEGRRFIDLAQQLGAPYVRVFPDKYVAGEPHSVTITRVVAGLRELGAYAAGKHVTVLLESHGDFTDSPTLGAVLERAAGLHVDLLWDAHHTFASGHEAPADTLRQLGPYIRHTHLKDSRPVAKDSAAAQKDPAAREYVLTGEGDVPVREQVRLLTARGYRGYYSLEWEKAWHPEIAEPEVALADFAKKMQEYLRR